MDVAFFGVEPLKGILFVLENVFFQVHFNRKKSDQLANLGRCFVVVPANGGDESLKLAENILNCKIKFSQYETWTISYRIAE